MLNTPNTWGIYLISLVCEWLEAQGGVSAMQKRNEQKPRCFTTRSTRATDFTAVMRSVRCRSKMNVTFRLPSEALERILRRGRIAWPRWAKGTPLRRRHSRVDLQRFSKRRRRSLGRIHEGFCRQKRLIDRLRRAATRREQFDLLPRFRPFADRSVPGLLQSRYDRRFCRSAVSVRVMPLCEYRIATR